MRGRPNGPGRHKGVPHCLVETDIESYGLSDLKARCGYFIVTKDKEKLCFYKYDIDSTVKQSRHFQ